jgi:hypothetical protein
VTILYEGFPFTLNTIIEQGSEFKSISQQMLRVIDYLSRVKGTPGNNFEHIAQVEYTRGGGR